MSDTQFQPDPDWVKNHESASDGGGIDVFTPDREVHSWETATGFHVGADGSLVVRLSIRDGDMIRPTAAIYASGAWTLAAPSDAQFIIEGPFTRGPVPVNEKVAPGYVKRS